MCRLMQEYEERRSAEGELSEQDMPAEMLAGVEAQHTEEDRCFCDTPCLLPSSLTANGPSEH